MKESTKTSLRVLGKMGVGLVSVIGWLTITKLIRYAKWRSDIYGQTTVHFNKHNEMDLELVVSHIILLFITGFSIYDIIKYIKSTY